jgi:hypothetical protein
MRLVAYLAMISSVVFHDEENLDESMYHQERIPRYGSELGVGDVTAVPPDYFLRCNDLVACAPSPARTVKHWGIYSSFSPPLSVTSSITFLNLW